MTSSRINLKQKQLFAKTAYCTSIQPVNLAQEEEDSELNIKNIAGTQVSVDTHLKPNQARK